MSNLYSLPTMPRACVTAPVTRLGLYVIAAPTIREAQERMLGALVALEARVDADAEGRPDEVIVHLCTWGRPAGCYTAIVGNADFVRAVHATPAGPRTWRNRGMEADQPRVCLRDNPTAMVFGDLAEGSAEFALEVALYGTIVLAALEAPSLDDALGALDRMYEGWSMKYDLAETLKQVTFSDNGSESVAAPTPDWVAAYCQGLREAA